MSQLIEVYIGVGANLDDPLAHVNKAIAEIQALDGCQDIAVSAIYRSAPLGPANQPDYINAAVCLMTTLSAEALLDALQAIEAAHGRQRNGERWGPRTLDLDILLYGQQQIQSPRLTIPHPQITQRNFVLQPLYDLDPELRIPGQGPVADWLAQISLNGLKKLE